MITKDNTLKVMELFFRCPEGKFHIREVGRLTELSMPGARKILAKLEKEGLLASKSEDLVKNFYAARNERFISLKRAYNIHSVFSSGLLDFLRKQYQEPEAIVLFGSYSKGEDISGSDIDIAIVTVKRGSQGLSRFEKVLGRKIRLYEVKIKAAEPEFLNSLANGVVLYGYLRVV